MKKLFKIPYTIEGFVIVEAEDNNAAMDEAEAEISSNSFKLKNIKFSDPVLVE